jgi:hypothetical protein
VLQAHDEAAVQAEWRRTTWFIYRCAGAGADDLGRPVAPWLQPPLQLDAISEVSLARLSQEADSRDVVERQPPSA